MAFSLPAVNRSKSARVASTISGAQTTADTTAAASSGDALARVLGIGGLVVGAVGVVLSVLTLRRRVTG